MAKLHELLAAEKPVTASWNTLHTETLSKLAKPQMFEGEVVALKMLEESEGNKAIEDAAKVHKAMPTNVFATFEYALDIFAKAEDLQFQKNATNAKAKATVMFRGKELLTGMPVDQLLGLEARLMKIRELYLAIPTLDASKSWTFNPNEGCWVGQEEHTTKTEKKLYGVILAPATEKHPAQVKEATEDRTVGKFTRVKRSGAATAVQKAEAIKVVDELLAECKMARQRANDETVVADKIGAKIVEVLLAPLKNT